ncbi:hypothetical protein ACHQM5_000890 [Ranunculus cassubicifolius]
MDMDRKLRKPPPIDRKPTLKEFLRDDFSSCSSSGFRSFPRKQSCYTSMRSLLEIDLKARGEFKPVNKLPKKKISAFQKASVAMISVVKHFQFSQKQSILPRSLSRRLIRSFTRKTDHEKINRESNVVVKVKDVLRWKSFGDILEEKRKQLDCAVSPIQTTITTTTTTTSSNSWSDSDFTSECVHSSWGGSSDCSGENENEEECKKYSPKKKNKIGKRRCNGASKDSMEKIHVEPKYEEKDQFSPVSVLDFPFEEDDESSSSFQSSLESLDRTKHKLMHKIRRFESLAKIEPLELEKRIDLFELECPSDSPLNSINTGVEFNEEEVESERARELVKLFTGTVVGECLRGTTNDLLFDFFRDEIIEKNVSKKAQKEDEMFKVAKDWLNGDNVLLDWTVEESRKVHIKEMERGGMWKEVEDEKKALAIEMEEDVLDLLMDEMLFDLLF